MGLSQIEHLQPSIRVLVRVRGLCFVLFRVWGVRTRGAVRATCIHDEVRGSL